jgi:hypothetical protein
MKMRVQVEYIKNEMVNGRLLPQREHSYEIVEIDETQGQDLEELAKEALGKKLGLSKDRYRFWSAVEV